MNDQNHIYEQEQPIDYQADAAEQAPVDKLQKLMNAYQLWKMNNNELRTIEQSVNILIEQQREIETKYIPEIMNELGIAEFTTNDGTKIKKEPWLACSIPTQNAINDQKDPGKKVELTSRRIAAFQWLHDVGASAIISNEVVVDIPKGKKDQAEELKLALNEIGLDWIEEETVHPQTLKSFLKQKLEMGKNVPEVAFGLVTGEKAKFKQV